MTGYPPQGGPHPGPPYPGYPPPVAPRPSQLSPWKLIAIIGAAGLVVVLLAVAALIVLQRNSSKSRSSTATTATTTSAAPALYRLDPAAVLPTVDQIQQATSLTVRPFNRVYTDLNPDPQADPANCSLADDPTSRASAWATATSLASEPFQVPGSDSIQVPVWTSVAVFDSAAAAQSSLDSLSQSAAGCTTFSRPAIAGNAPGSWQISDAQSLHNEVTWNVAQIVPPSNGWRCSNDYQVVANLAFYSQLCGINPSGELAARLTAVVIGNATRR